MIPTVPLAWLAGKAVDAVRVGLCAAVGGHRLACRWAVEARRLRAETQLRHHPAMREFDAVGRDIVASRSASR